MRRLTVLAGLLVGLWTSLAHAAIGTPVQLGTASGTTTAVITTTADAPIGSLIVVVASVGTLAVAVSSVVDSQLNCTTYTLLDNTPVASRPTVAVAYCANTASDLAIGQTITITVPSTDVVAATAFAVSGMASSPVDTHGNTSNGTGTFSTSVATGTRAQTLDLVVGAVGLSNTSSAFTPNGKYTSIGGISSASGSAYAAYQLICVTNSLAFAPQWTTSRTYMADVVSFKAAALNTICNSKQNTYVVLTPGTTASKINTYVVLTPGTARGGLLFQGVP